MTLILTVKKSSIKKWTVWKSSVLETQEYNNITWTNWCEDWRKLGDKCLSLVSIDITESDFACAQLVQPQQELKLKIFIEQRFEAPPLRQVLHEGRTWRRGGASKRCFIKMFNTSSCCGYTYINTCILFVPLPRIHFYFLSCLSILLSIIERSLPASAEWLMIIPNDSPFSFSKLFTCLSYWLHLSPIFFEHIIPDVFNLTRHLAPKKGFRLKLHYLVLSFFWQSILLNLFRSRFGFA